MGDGLGLSVSSFAFVPLLAISQEHLVSFRNEANSFRNAGPQTLLAFFNFASMTLLLLGSILFLVTHWRTNAP